MECSYPPPIQLPRGSLPSTVRRFCSTLFRSAPLISMLFVGVLSTTLSDSSHAAAAATSPAPRVGDFPPAQLGPNRQGDAVNREQRRGKVVVTF